MSDPFEAHASFDFTTRTIVAFKGEPVPFQTLVEAAQAAQRGNRKETRAITLLYLRTVGRFAATLIGISGLLLAALGFGAWLMLARHPGTLPAAVVWTGVSVIGVAILILRSIARANDGDSHFFISESAGLAMSAHAEARGALARTSVLDLERRAHLSRLPSGLRQELELLGNLGMMHRHELERFKEECAKARCYVDRGHMTVDEAASKLQLLRSRLKLEQGDLEKAIKLADRLAVAHAHGSCDERVITIEHQELIRMLDRMKEAFSCDGRGLESIPAADVDPRYPDGLPHD